MITIGTQLPAEFAQAFMLTFARVGAMLMLLPGFGERMIPARARLVIALVVSLMMVGLVRPLIGPIPTDTFMALALLVHEVLVGLFIGMTVRFVATAMATAGTIVAQQIGFGFVTQVDPTQGGQSLLLANFMTLLGVAVVFAMDLHHLAIGAVYDSYRLFRPGAELPVGDFVRAGVEIFASSFTLAIKIAAPLIVLGLVFQIAMGILGRLMPQLQIFFLAMPIQVVAGFLLLAALMASIVGWYGMHVAEAIDRLRVR
jgi:flagellar biosynthesis protein FliR